MAMGTAIVLTCSRLPDKLLLVRKNVRLLDQRSEIDQTLFDFPWDFLHGIRACYLRQLCTFDDSFSLFF